MLTRTKPLIRALAGVASLLLLAFLILPSVHAFDARTGDQLTIGADQVIDDDLYVAGQTVTIDGTIHGDVVAAGQMVVVNGTVDGSLIAAGQTVIVNGTVRDSARIAGQALQLGTHARIGRDLMSAAYSLESQAGSAIGRDLAYAGYQGLLSGDIGRNVRGDINALALRGTVAGDVNVAVGSGGEPAGRTMGSPPPGIIVPVVSPGLSVSDDARVGGHLTYTSGQEFPIAGRIGQGVTYTARAVEPEAAAPSLLSIVGDNVRRLIAIGAIGLLVLWLAPRLTNRLMETMERKPLPSLGWGFVAAVATTAAFIGIAVATALLGGAFGVVTLWNLTGLVIVLGLLAEAVIATGLTVYATLVAEAMVSYVAGRLVLRRIYPVWAEHRIAPLLVGLPLFVLITALPVLGPIIGILAALAAFGSVWIRVRDRMPPSADALPVEPLKAAA